MVARKSQRLRGSLPPETVLLRNRRSPTNAAARSAAVNRWPLNVDVSGSDVSLEIVQWGISSEAALRQGSQKLLQALSGKSDLETVCFVGGPKVEQRHSSAFFRYFAREFYSVIRKRTFLSGGRLREVVLKDIDFDLVEDDCFEILFLRTRRLQALRVVNPRNLSWTRSFFTNISIPSHVQFVLRGFDFDGEEFVSLCEFLFQDNANVQVLDLSGNSNLRITAQLEETPWPSSLHSVSLGGSRLTPSVLLSAPLAALRRLDLSNCRITPPEWADLFTQRGRYVHPAIRLARLDVSHTNMGDDELQRMLTSPLLDDLEWLSLAYTTVTAEGLMVATRALPHGLVVINLAGIPLSSKHVSITCSLVGITGPFDETGCRDWEAPTPVPPPTWNCLTGPEFESGGICALRVSVPPTTAEFEELCQLLSVIPTLNHLYFEGVAPAQEGSLSDILSRYASTGVWHLLTHEGLQCNVFNGRSPRSLVPKRLSMYVALSPPLTPSAGLDRGLTLEAYRVGEMSVSATKKELLSVCSTLFRVLLTQCCIDGLTAQALLEGNVPSLLAGLEVLRMPDSVINLTILRNLQELRSDSNLPPVVRYLLDVTMEELPQRSIGLKFQMLGRLDFQDSLYGSGAFFEGGSGCLASSPQELRDLWEERHSPPLPVNTREGGRVLIQEQTSVFGVLPNPPRMERTPAAAQVCPAVRNAFDRCRCRETIVVTITEDSCLRDLLDPITRSCRNASEQEAALKIRDYVESVMSRPGPNTEDLAQKCHGFVKLGEVRQGKARHKALLYKLICDALKLDCSIHRNDASVWNIVSVGDERHLTRLWVVSWTSRKVPVQLSSLKEDPSSVVELDEAFTFHSLIGKGSFGEVWKVEVKRCSNRLRMLEPSEHKFYALKLASIEDEDVPIEADLLLKHRHTCVVPLIAVFVGQQVEVQRNRQKSKQKFMCLLMTLATGNLETQLLKASGSTSERLTPQQARIILLDTARGMAYLHTPSQSQEHLLHRDLKPANILLDNTSGPLWRAQIADFGVSTLRKENGMTDMTMGPGTDGYIAPEQQTTVYSRPADVWSFGVVVSRLIGWEHWKDLTGLGLQRFVRSCHEDAYLKDLAVRCLSPDPLLRPSFKDIQGMLWLDLLRSEFEAAVTRLCSRKGHTLRAVSHGLSPGKENTSDSFFFQ